MKKECTTIIMNMSQMKDLNGLVAKVAQQNKQKLDSMTCVFN